VPVAGYRAVDATDQADQLIFRQEHHEDHPICIEPRL
jgi:hypothetical protein